MTKAVLFDLDGTVLDSEPDFTLILNQMLNEQGKPGVNVAQVRQCISNGARALVTLAFDTQEGADNFEDCLSHFLEYYANKVPSTESRLFDGMSELLTQFDQQGLPWGIVTNKASRFTLPLMQAFPALTNCSSTICSDHVQTPKPSPEGVLLACEQLQCAPQDTLYVGDHPRDIEAGRAAGMKTAAVTWGYLPASPAIEDWQADHVISHPREITAIL